MTGLGGISQLTGNSAAAEGYAWLGGILIQWGKVTFGIGVGGTVTFQMRTNCIPFPNNLFMVNATEFFIDPNIPLGDHGIFIDTNAVTFLKTSFNWYRISNTNSKGFFWMAIGN